MLPLILAGTTAWATAQEANVLSVDGAPHAMFSDALPPWLSLNWWERARAVGWSTSTACHQGFVSTWAIDEGTLWLTGARECWPGTRTWGVGSHDGLTRVTANWYTGVIVLPQGDLAHYIHGGWASIFTEERHIRIAGGRVVSDEVVQIVPPGFTVVGEFDPVFAPSGIAPEGRLLDEGARRWWAYSDPADERSLRYLVHPSVDTEGRGDLATATARLSEHLGVPPDRRWRHRELGSRGVVIWSDRREAGDVVRTLVWEHPWRGTVVMEFRTPDRRERATFVDLLAFEM